MWPFKKESEVIRILRATGVELKEMPLTQGYSMANPTEKDPHKITVKDGVIFTIALPQGGTAILILSPSTASISGKESSIVGVV